MWIQENQTNLQETLFKKDLIKYFSNRNTENEFILDFDQNLRKIKLKLRKYVERNLNRNWNEKKKKFKSL